VEQKAKALLSNAKSNAESKSKKHGLVKLWIKRPITTTWIWARL